MKIRSACYCCLLSVAVLTLASLSLIVAQEEENKAGGALGRDPFLKTPGNVVSAAADPFGAGGAGGAGPAAEDDPFGGGARRGPQAMVEPVGLLEYIQTDLVTANELLSKYGTLEDMAPLREELEKLLDGGEAKLVETCFLRTTLGQRMKTHSVSEYIYPTEFNPPNGSQTFDGESQSWPIASASPSAFDMRLVGTTVEFEMNFNGVQAKPRKFYFKVAPEIVRNLGDRLVAAESIPETRIQRMPDFASMQLNASAGIAEGASSLLGVMRSPADEGQRVMVLLTVDSLKPEVPEAREEGDDPTWVVTHYEYIKLDQRAANRLLRRELGQRDAGRLRAQLAEMIAAGDAELVDTSYFKASAGHRVESASVREHIYATEYDPPKVPQTLTVEGGGGRPSGATPRALESRSVGAIIIQECNVQAFDMRISLNFSCELVKHLGDFSAAMMGQLARLDRLYEEHLRRLASMDLKDRFALRKACDGIVGVRQLALAVDVESGARAEPFQTNFESGYRGVPILPGQALPALGGDYYKLPAEELAADVEDHGWVDRPGQPLMFWQRREPGVYAVVTPDVSALEAAVHGWLGE